MPHVLLAKPACLDASLAARCSSAPHLTARRIA
jgi:hypothetical protein